ncbi:multiheme c-type cytochrome [Nitrosococcus watsonii]|uniref:Hydroxylamine oxidoreductase n=1 Tax=Nitrosococcus watsoni (strain C-113) TaxID=105559 RepID=D8KBV1_NITWC|nr:multiheme c-type cytochrome [Nitrosococcus watsonii]ADJ27712.1 Hydroxylamine oxidase [Nitrosococcus watsonii C-113]
MSDSIIKRLLRAIAAVFSVSLLFVGNASADIPDELYEALGVDKYKASPKELYEAITERYYDPAQGHGEGKYAEYWEPLPFSQYLDPYTYYSPPAQPAKVATREECIECHEDETRGWVHAWRKSVHANLDEIRNLPKDDSRYYKKKLIKEVEDNLRSMGKLEKNENLKEVSCIDCHVGVGAEKGHHNQDLRLPDAAVCGTCHLQQFAERESERDTIVWPDTDVKGNKIDPVWPPGRPSHALDYQANVDLATWAAMEDREVADGCTMCHINQNRCDTCHTRHQFSAVEARKPDACGNCHNGADHNEYENYLMSKHGTTYLMLGDTWDWEVPLKDAIAENEQTAPTCAFCHMEYKGRFGHNVVRKVRWAFNPQEKIANNLEHEWYEKRNEAWIETCTNCHSATFAESYLEFVDNGIISGLKKQLEAKQIVEALYEDGLLPGQKTNRPAPPKPEHDAPGEFFQLFIAKGNNPTTVELQYSKMWEQDLLKHYKALAHVNPGFWTYTEGWGPLLERYTNIQDANTQLRAFAKLKSQVAMLEGDIKAAKLLNLDSQVERAVVGGLGGGMVLAGVGLVAWRRKQKTEG